jgi:hypothetical protein
MTKLLVNPECSGPLAETDADFTPGIVSIRSMSRRWKPETSVHPGKDEKSCG